VTWPFFLAQVDAFEAANKTLSLDARITKLRQWSHEKKLNFDSVIGTAHGSEYLDTRGFVKEEWEILKDSQVVTTPGGEDVNVYHLMVGLDVLTKKVEHQTDWRFAIGQNYAASTWSGDLGSAAADAMLAQDKDWESVFISPKAPEASKRSARLAHYYQTRAPETEMLGDLDAWGIDEERSADSSLTSIAKLLASYYGPATAGGSRKPTGKRKKSIEAFLRNYGFVTASPLKGQTAARDAMKEQVLLFAKQWLRNRKDSPYSGTDKALADMTTWYIEPMLDQYLDWLDGLVKTYGALIAPAKATPPP
jgi:hypothetical protein